MKTDLDVVVKEKKVKTYNDKIVLSSHKNTLLVDVSEIVYLSSNGCYTTFYLLNNSYFTTSKPLSYYNKLLENNNFFRIHHKYLINIKYTKEIISGLPFKVKLSNDVVLPVTKIKKNDFVKLFIH